MVFQNKIVTIDKLILYVRITLLLDHRRSIRNVTHEAFSCEKMSVEG
jgi:hypothetical protein